MINKKIALVALLATSFAACRHEKDTVNRPRIVVGIVVDQMRWDYLYRYYDQYKSDGFRRLLRNGYSCEQTMISYLPSFTAPGHSCIYTGSVPAIHGIAGNEWIDRSTGAFVYCVDDTALKNQGVPKEEAMSPANLLTTTITDELKLATNFNARVYGVALKDRSSILPAGHLADAAYWYSEEKGGFVSSKYYHNPSPQWLATFNGKNLPQAMLKDGWYMLHDSDNYRQSTADKTDYEGNLPDEDAPVFPHDGGRAKQDAWKSLIKLVPAGNAYTLAMAKACIEGEKLGYRRGQTDFLAVSLSATDYVGHRFAPNSMEAEDTYMRLDKELSDFIDFLDAHYGAHNYLLFLTADHGGAHNPKFLTDKGVPAGVEQGGLREELNQVLSLAYGVDSLALLIENYQVSLNEPLIAARGVDRESIRQTTMSWLAGKGEVAYIADLENMWRTTIPEPIKTMIVNGYNPARSGTIQYVTQPAWYDNGGRKTGTTHGTWNPYDTHIPLIWYGWHMKRGATNEQVYMTDIAPTLAALLHIQMPNGCVGKPINDLMRIAK